MTRTIAAMSSTVAMAGCLSGSPSITNTAPAQSTSASTASVLTANATSSGTTTDTFDHMNEDTTDPFTVLAREAQEGPPEIATRMHSCGKMKYATLGNVLADFGIDLTQTDASTPSGLYQGGASALGKPDYSNRIAEGVTLTTAGSVRLYDIFVAAVPAIVTAMPTTARCMVAGAATSMFASDGSCTMAGISCVTGAPATQQQKDLCDSAVQSNAGDTVGTGTGALTVGQVVAVASLLAAAHTCE